MIKMDKTEKDKKYCSWKEEKVCNSCTRDCDIRSEMNGELNERLSDRLRILKEVYVSSSR